MWVQGSGYGRYFEWVFVWLQCLHRCNGRERNSTRGEDSTLTLSEPLKGKTPFIFWQLFHFNHVARQTSCMRGGTYGCRMIWTKRKNFQSEIIEETNKFCIALYNEYMGGIDYNDHLCGSYHVQWKCMKNYKYVFLFDVSITNDFILYSNNVRSSPPMDKKHFRLMLAKQLTWSYMSRKHAGHSRKRPRSPSSGSSIPTEHFPMHFKCRCVYCRDIRSQPRRKESMWVCTGEPTLWNKWWEWLL